MLRDDDGGQRRDSSAAESTESSQHEAKECWTAVVRGVGGGEKEEGGQGNGGSLQMDVNHRSSSNIFCRLIADVFHRKQTANRRTLQNTDAGQPA